MVGMRSRSQGDRQDRPYNTRIMHPLRSIVRATLAVALASRMIPPSTVNASSC